MHALDRGGVKVCDAYRSHCGAAQASTLSAQRVHAIDATI